MIQMAHGLGMTPLAEGIETEEQWRFLTDVGCTLGQGYYFSKPVPADDITQRYVWGNVGQPS
jgi:EAL domain-containing protein (putative c-di-GMP-specific phosphodiesterase class I)